MGAANNKHKQKKDKIGTILSSSTHKEEKPMKANDMPEVEGNPPILKGYFFLLCLNEIARPYGVPEDIIHECGLIYVDFHLACKKDLFPLFGITLGITTRDELSKLGQVLSRDFPNCYVVNDVNFWCHKSTVPDPAEQDKKREADLANHMYLTNGDLPKQWSELGFSFDMSYNEWLVFLKDRRWTVKVVHQPKITAYLDSTTSTCLHAEVKASKKMYLPKCQVPIEITLSFNYGEGRTLVTDPRTLYSIWIEQKLYIDATTDEDSDD